MVITREVLILRVKPNDMGIDPFLLLTVMSLKVVQNQYQHLGLMQTNREHLGDHWREVRLPIPRSRTARARIARPFREYCEAMIAARESYDDIFTVFEEYDFGTRP